MNRMTLIFLLLAGTTAAPLATGDTEPPTVSLEGLQLVEKDRRGELYADPGVDWSVYDQIRLDRATVAFRRNWQRDQNRFQHMKVQASDMERIKSSLADLFDEVFSEELGKNGGYVLTEASGNNVMRITPRIVDLDIYAPDTRTVGIQKSYTEQAGKMTLKLEIYDSLTGDLIATASDRRESPRRGYMQWTTSVTNTAEARRMLERWAIALRERLDDARSTGTLTAE